MTDYPIVRFVSAPDVTAETRFDFHLNDGDSARSWSDRRDWSWQPGGLLGEPDGIGAEYGLGRLDMTLYVGRSRSDALQTMSALARELQRDENWLLFQLDPTSPPMWLKVYRPSPGALTFPYVDPDRPDDDVWLLDVSLPTDPRAYGERVTHSVTVANDPATGGLAVTLPEIKGDAPAPLVISFAASAYQRPVFAVTPYSGDAQPIQFWQAESWTLGADAAVAASASASGGSQVVVNFAGDTSMTTRLTGDVTTAKAGRYLLFARVQVRPTGTDTTTIRGGGGALVRATSTDLEPGGYALVELGEYAFPKGNYPTSPDYTLTSGGADVTVRASRSGSGSSFLDIDYIVAVHVDGFDLMAPATVLRVVESFLGKKTDAGLIVDGEAETLGATVAGEYLPRSAGTALGSFVRVVPGAANVLHYFMGSYGGETTPADVVTKSHTLTISYAPRHLWLPS